MRIPFSGIPTLYMLAVMLGIDLHVSTIYCAFGKEAYNDLG